MPWVECPMCGGAKEINGKECRNCQGSGRKYVSAMDRGK